MSATLETNARDAYLMLVRAHEKLTTDFVALFRDAGLTMPQYNALRILNGGPKEGASCQYIGERLLNRVPDVTRMIDRLIAAGLVTRSRSTEDRRVVLTKITAKGRKLIKSLERPVLQQHRDQLSHMKASDLRTLTRLLQEALGDD